MSMMLDPELLGSTVIALAEGIDVIEALVDGDNPDALGSAIRAARANITTLSIISAELVADAMDGAEQEDPEPGPDPDRPATDNPETCGHPRSLDLGSQIMCETCGASRAPGTSGPWTTW